jgi:hypothetical protein
MQIIADRTVRYLPSKKEGNGGKRASIDSPRDMKKFSTCGFNLRRNNEKLPKVKEQTHFILLTFFKENITGWIPEINTQIFNYRSIFDYAEFFTQSYNSKLPLVPLQSPGFFSTNSK